MDTDGTHDGQRVRADHVPRPTRPGLVSPVQGLAPPRPAHAPSVGPGLTDWLSTPRPEAGPGIWRFGYRPREGREPEEATDRALLSGAVISFLACVLVWSLLSNNYIPYTDLPLKLFTPGTGGTWVAIRSTDGVPPGCRPTCCW